MQERKLQQAPPIFCIIINVFSLFEKLSIPHDFNIRLTTNSFH